jgi:hypothetical protein
MAIMLGGFQPLPATGPGLLLEAIHRVVLRLGNEEGVGEEDRAWLGSWVMLGWVGFGVWEDVGEVAAKRQKKCSDIVSSDLIIV